MSFESPCAVTATRVVKSLGSQAALARLCGLSQQSISKWVRRNRLIPAEYVLAVEAATGISRHDLRPDIYPRPQADPRAPGHLEGVRP